MQELDFQMENQLNWRSQQCTLETMKAFFILGWISKMNLMPFSTLVRSSMKYWIQLVALQYNIDIPLGKYRKREPGCFQKCTVKPEEEMDARWNMGKF